MKVKIKYASVLSDDEVVMDVDTMEQFANLYDFLERSSNIAKTYFGFSGLIVTKNDDVWHVVVYDDYVE